MAKKETKKTVSSTEAKVADAALKKQAQVGAIVAKHRAALNEELKRIDPALVMELAVGPAIEQVADIAAFFSDWPDTWNDGGRWVKTWGKGGDEAMLPLETLRERMQLARMKGLLKDTAKKSGA
jgi:hypothetical protein